MHLIFKGEERGKSLDGPAAGYSVTGNGEFSLLSVIMMQVISIGVFFFLAWYVLAPPSECEHLEIIKPREHPSFRHSSADWSDPKAQSPDSALADALAIDTVVHAGEILYIPSFWFHYIQKLERDSDGIRTPE